MIATGAGNFPGGVPRYFHCVDGCVSDSGNDGTKAVFFAPFIPIRDDWE